MLEQNWSVACIGSSLSCEYTNSGTQTAPCERGRHKPGFKSSIKWSTYGGFLKWWYPTTMGFPTKNVHFGVFWGYHYLRKHHLRKHPYINHLFLNQCPFFNKNPHHLVGTPPKVYPCFTWILCFPSSESPFQFADFQVNHVKHQYAISLGRPFNIFNPSSWDLKAINTEKKVCKVVAGVISERPTPNWAKAQFLRTFPNWK